MNILIVLLALTSSALASPTAFKANVSRRALNDPSVTRRQILHVHTKSTHGHKFAKNQKAPANMIHRIHTVKAMKKVQR